ncbi:MAG: DDE-type integrase/transposase/recombinase [Defluviicoccus sp.]|nr:MAG: DDE-type integrase/transposase/recombinase [Defluviicoccus sp.]
MRRDTAGFGGSPRTATTACPSPTLSSARPFSPHFLATRPNDIWLADISDIPTDDGWPYLAVVLDRFSGKLVGWAMRDHLRQESAIKALTMAIQRPRPNNVRRRTRAEPVP